MNPTARERIERFAATRLFIQKPAGGKFILREWLGGDDATRTASDASSRATKLEFFADLARSTPESSRAAIYANFAKSKNTTCDGLPTGVY